MKKTLLVLLIAAMCAFAGEHTREIWPAESDLLYGSSVHIQFTMPGYSKDKNLIVGKGNVFDHRYRQLVRIPLDKLLPKGYVNKAVLSYKIKLYAGSVPEREFMLEMLEHNAYNVTATDLQATRVTDIQKFSMSRNDVNQVISLDVTEAVNKALEEVWNGVIFRLRQDPEPNDDKGASGPAIYAESIVLTVE